MNLELLQFGKELIQLCNKVEELKLENNTLNNCVITLNEQKINLYNDLQLAEQVLASNVIEIEKLKDVIKAIHAAGGIAVLAHPACCFTLSLDRYVKKLISYGLDGMEVYYPYKRHRKFIRFNTAENVKKIAEKYNLIKTGGTDEHTQTLNSNKYFD